MYLISFLPMQLATYIRSGALRQGTKILTYASATAGFYFEEAFHLAWLMEYAEVRERWLNTILKASHRYHNVSQLIHITTYHNLSMLQNLP